MNIITQKSRVVICILLLISINCLGNKPVKYDNGDVEIRTPDQGTIEKYKDKRDFKYEPRVKNTDTFFRRLRYKIAYIWHNIITKSKLYPVIKYLIIGGLMVLIILQATKTRLSTIFYRHLNKSTVSISELDINMEDDKLEKMILDAISSKKYRIALRYLYIKLLKLLSSHNLINWKKGKTDHDYFNELKATTYHEPFRKLSIVYEYTWYGNFLPKEEQFLKLNDEFNNFFIRVNEKK